MMKILLTLFCCGLVLSSHAQTQTSTQRVKALDGVVAVVNSEVITRAELELRVARLAYNLRQQNITLPPRSALREQVLERLVLDKLQVQLAREQGIRVDEGTLDRTIARIAEQNRMTVPQLRSQLDKEGLAFTTFREQIREEIMGTRVREREVERRIHVTESEVEAYLKQMQGDDSSVQINLGQILVRVPEGATAQQVAERRARAENLLEKLKSGNSFASLAEKHSEGFEATRGGEMGLRALDRYPQAFIEAVRSLKKGEFTGVVQSPAGFHLLYIIDRQDAYGTASAPVPLPDKVQQTRARHILLRNIDGLTHEEAQRRLNDYKQRIENQAATFEDLARRFSRDGSAAQGGDLGWIYPGDTVPDFERALNALKPGEISAPVQSPFGWHLIQVLERKNSEIDSDRKKLIARQAVRDRKVEEATEDWLRELRDAAYVELRLDN